VAGAPQSNRTFRRHGRADTLTHSTTGRSTTMPRHVTQRQAQAVLRAVKTQFASYGPDFGDLQAGHGLGRPRRDHLGGRSI